MPEHRAEAIATADEETRRNGGGREGGGGGHGSTSTEAGVSPPPLRTSSSSPENDPREGRPCGKAEPRVTSPSPCQIADIPLAATVPAKTDDLKMTTLTIKLKRRKIIPVKEIESPDSGGTTETSGSSFQSITIDEAESPSPTPKQVVPSTGWGFLSSGFFTKQSDEAHDTSSRVGAWPWQILKSTFGHKDSTAGDRQSERAGSAVDHAPELTWPRLWRSRVDLRTAEFTSAATTMIVLEQRPANLPPKPLAEQERHRVQYEAMLCEIQKQEEQACERRRRLEEERCRREEVATRTTALWSHGVLPRWQEVCKSRKVRSLWWAGIPPSVRGLVWQRSIGNQLNITPELYEIFLARWKELEDSCGDCCCYMDGLGASVAPGNQQLEAMTLDISSTFPDLHIFQKGGPLHDSLRNVLGAYATYRPDVGYAPMTSWLAAMLLLYMDAVEAFVVLANILNQPCMLAFALPRPDQVNRYLATFDVFFEENLPGLFTHFKKIGLLPDVYLGGWVLVLLAHALPLECACRARDVWFRDGEEFAFRAALGTLSAARRLPADPRQGGRGSTPAREVVSYFLVLRGRRSLLSDSGDAGRGAVLRHRRRPHGQPPAIVGSGPHPSGQWVGRGTRVTRDFVQPGTSITLPSTLSYSLWAT
ncbi:TBC1 domain family member 12-like isoform X2 [Lethenteron reissneri]|uniref:TBC1 domain family member 12-like isoform X2 n=1 Tax=Lethenteron reissneri TaxID=7753 RepID=UPI002AB5E215|nr:TBC1 domain family member 12-like isoform X2 [Lethenteron reissneri]